MRKSKEMPAPRQIGLTPSKPPSTRLAMEREVLRKIRVIFSSARKHFHSIEQQCGISGSQLWALIELRDHSGLKVTELATIMSIHQSTASNLLAKLKQKKLVQRERLDHDQRVVRLSLTVAGLRVVANAPKPARGVVPDALGKIPPAQLAKLREGLEALVERLAIADKRGKARPLADI